MRLLIPVISLSLAWLGASANLDASLATKKKESGAPATTIASTGTADSSSDSSLEAATAAPPVAAPVVRLADNCVVEVCAKDAGYRVKKVNIAPWWNTYWSDILRHNKFFDDDNEARYNEIPLWTVVEWCITIKQQGDYTHVNSWYKNVPANRMYFVLVGTVAYEEDSKKRISQHKHACQGHTLMSFKYLIDIFLTGDDYTELPTLPDKEHLVDHKLYGHEDSKVHYRVGDTKFRGQIMKHMGGWRDRKAYWMMDATLLEQVDAIDLLEYNRRESWPLESHVTSKTVRFVPKASRQRTNRYRFYQLLLRERQHDSEASVDRWPMFSFWFTFRDKDSWLKLKTQQALLFEPDKTYTFSERGVYFITNVQHDAKEFMNVGLVHRPCVGWTVDFLTKTPSILRGIAPELNPDLHEGEEFKHTLVAVDTAAYEEGIKRNSQYRPPTRDNVEIGLLAPIYTVTYGGLFSTWKYSEYKIHLSIVACGLFKKAFPKPKRCEAGKEKREGEGGA